MASPSLSAESKRVSGAASVERLQDQVSARTKVIRRPMVPDSSLTAADLSLVRASPPPQAIVPPQTWPMPVVTSSAAPRHNGSLGCRSRHPRSVWEPLSAASRDTRMWGHRRSRLTSSGLKTEMAATHRGPAGLHSLNIRSSPAVVRQRSRGSSTHASLTSSEQLSAWSWPLQLSRPNSSAGSARTCRNPPREWSRSRPITRYATCCSFDKYLHGSITRRRRHG